MPFMSSNLSHWFQGLKGLDRVSKFVSPEPAPICLVSSNKRALSASNKVDHFTKADLIKTSNKVDHFTSREHKF